MRMRSVCVFKALAEWSECVLRKRKLFQIVRAFRNKGLRSCYILFAVSFFVWASRSARCKALYHAALCVSRKARRRLLGSVFVRIWNRGMVHREFVHAIVMNWRRTYRSCLRRCVRTWTDFVSRQIVLRRSASMLLTRAWDLAIALSFGCWSQIVIRKRFRRAKLSTAHRRGARQKLQTILAAWCLLSTESVRMCASMSKIIVHLQRRGLSLAWNTWLMCTEQWKMQKQAEGKKQRLIQKVLSRMMNGVLSSAFRLWSSQVIVMGSCRQVMEKVVLQLMKRLVCKCFCHWVDMVADAKYDQLRLATCDHKVKVICGRLLGRSVSTCFGAWNQHILYARRLQAVVQKMQEILLRRNFLRQLDAWMEYVRKKTDIRTRLGRVVRSIANTSFTRGLLVPGRVRLILHSWRDRILDKRQRNEDARRVIFEWNRVIKVHVLSALLDNAALCKEGRIREQEGAVVAQESVFASFSSSRALVEEEL
jgi:hypothetical protein